MNLGKFGHIAITMFCVKENCIILMWRKNYIRWKFNNAQESNFYNGTL